MAKSRLVNTKFWTDGYVLDELNPVDKLVYLYLITNPHTDICGVYELPLKVMAVETGIDKDNLEKVLLPRFEKDGKIRYFKGWVAVKNFIKHQTSNPKVQTGIEIGLNKAPKELKAFMLGIEPDSLSIEPEAQSHPNPNSNTNSNTAHSAEDETSLFIKLFGGINPSYGELFKRKPQRAAAERLLKLHPIEWWQKFMTAYSVVLEDRYCPRATTPSQMEDKLAAIMAYGRQKRTEKIKGNNFII